MKKYTLFLLVVIFYNSIINAQQGTSIDRIFKNGFWIDFGAGFSAVYKLRNAPCHSSSNNWGYSPNCHNGTLSQGASWANQPSFSLNAGNKWYFPTGENYQLGFQITWLGVGLNLGGDVYIDIGAIGFCSLFRLTEKTGIEANLNIGPTVYMNNYGYTGIQGNLGLRYRVGYFTVGTTFRYFRSIYTPTYSGLYAVNLLLSLGCKF